MFNVIPTRISTYDTRNTDKIPLFKKLCFPSSVMERNNVGDSFCKSTNFLDFLNFLFRTEILNSSDQPQTAFLVVIIKTDLNCSKTLP